MILTIAEVADFDQFLKIFSTEGVEKRREHGCKGFRVFRDPDNRLFVPAVGVMPVGGGLGRRR